MDLQALINSMNENHSRTRAGYHLTLGGLLDALQASPDDLPVVFEDGTPAGEFDSYRGYYTDIAIDTNRAPKTVREWRDLTKIALKTTFEGYKGGDYPASPIKPLWRSDYGVASGVAIIGTEVRSDAFVLMAKQID